MRGFADVCRMHRPSLFNQDGLQRLAVIGRAALAKVHRAVVEGCTTEMGRDGRPSANYPQEEEKHGRAQDR